MVQAKMGGGSLPVVVKDDPRDGAKMKAVKKLIREMTAYEPKERNEMSAVLRTLEDIDGGEYYWELAAVN